jgi:hypothetical protein
MRAPAVEAPRPAPGTAPLAGNRRHERASRGTKAKEINMTTAVVLVRPREEGNVGAAARAMANMGLERLILVEPAAQLGVMARAFAVGAGDILGGAVRAASLREALAPFSCVVGTTSTRDRRWAVPLIGPRELPQRLAAEPPDASIALVFGPEVGHQRGAGLRQPGGGHPLLGAPADAQSCPGSPDLDL